MGIITNFRGGSNTCISFVLHKIKVWWLNTPHQLLMTWSLSDVHSSHIYYIKKLNLYESLW